MSGRVCHVNFCKSCFYMGLVARTGMALKRPDKTGHFRTLGQKALKTDDAALGPTKLTTKARRRTRRSPAAG